MMSASNSEAARMAEVYRGGLRQARAKWYSWHRPEVQWNIYRLRSVSSKFLKSSGLSGLEDADILDVGCGSGGWLRALLDFGASPDRLHGVDMIPERIAYARKRAAPGCDLRIGDGGELPYADSSMDLVTAHTVFSSIPDPGLRNRVAGEMWRVCKPGGLLMIYDFRIKDPRNPDTVRIGVKEIRRLFPAGRHERRSLTLLSPLLRRVAPISLPLAAVLEWCCPFLRTHLATLITKSK